MPDISQLKSKLGYLKEPLWTTSSFTCTIKRILKRIWWTITPQQEQFNAATCQLLELLFSTSDSTHASGSTVNSALKVHGDTINYLLGKREEHEGRLTKLSEMLTGQERCLWQTSAQTTQILESYWRLSDSIFEELKRQGVIQNEPLRASGLVKPSFQQKELDCGRVALYLGPGELEDYITVSGYDLAGVDVVADLKNIPLADVSVDEIRAVNQLENFSEDELRDKVLPHWHGLLKEGAKLTVVSPNFGAMINDIVVGDRSFKDLQGAVFTRQPGYLNYACRSFFDVLTLEQLLREAGFSDVNVVAEARRNGRSYEMEIEAFK